MGLAHRGCPGLEVIDDSGRCRVTAGCGLGLRWRIAGPRGPYWAVSRYHAHLPVDPVIDKSVIDGVVELDGRDLGVDEEQCVSGFVILRKNNAEHY